MKAILVIDMPKCCIECGFSQRTYETWSCIARERFEKGDWRIEDIKKKPNWCPLLEKRK